MIFAASTSLPSTRRSLAESFDRSVPMSVGANRAVIVSSVFASGMAPVLCARRVATATPASNSGRDAVSRKRRRMVINASVQREEETRRLALARGVLRGGLVLLGDERHVGPQRSIHIFVARAGPLEPGVHREPRRTMRNGLGGGRAFRKSPLEILKRRRALLRLQHRVERVDDL